MARKKTARKTSAAKKAAGKKTAREAARKAAASPAPGAPPAPEAAPPKAKKVKLPDPLPEMGNQVLYREPAPGDAITNRAAVVIAIGSNGCAQLAVFTIVPPCAAQPRAQPCRLAVGVEYSQKAKENTWGSFADADEA